MSSLIYELIKCRPKAKPKAILTPLVYHQMIGPIDCLLTFITHVKELNGRFEWKVWGHNVDTLWTVVGGTNEMHVAESEVSSVLKIGSDRLVQRQSMTFPVWFLILSWLTIGSVLNRWSRQLNRWTAWAGGFGRTEMFNTLSLFLLSEPLPHDPTVIAYPFLFLTKWASLYGPTLNIPQSCKMGPLTQVPYHKAHQPFGLTTWLQLDWKRFIKHSIFPLISDDVG